MQGTSEKQLDSFGAIADGAEIIAKNCVSNVNILWWVDYYTAGQAFYNDDWSVVVAEVDDDC